MIRPAVIAINAALLLSLLADGVLLVGESLGLLGSKDVEFALAGTVGLPIAVITLLAAALTIWGLWRLVHQGQRGLLLVADIVAAAVVVLFLAPAVVYDPVSILATPIRAATLVLAVVGAVLAGSPLLSHQNMAQPRNTRPDRTPDREMPQA